MGIPLSKKQSVVASNRLPSSNEPNEANDIAGTDGSITEHSILQVVKRKTNSLPSVQQSGKFSVRQKSDKFPSNITGCCFTPEGELVLCDFMNAEVKLFDKSLKLQKCLHLQESPWNVAILNNTNIVVTFPKALGFQEIQISPLELKGDTISIGFRCYGIGIVGELIYVSGPSNGNSDKVIVYNKSGKLQFGFARSLIEPRHIAVPKSGDKLFVSDFVTSIVSCFTLEGENVWQYNNTDLLIGPQLNCPQCLYAVDSENIIVCDWLDGNVKIISADRKRHKLRTLLSLKDGMLSSQCLTFRPDDGTLVVGGTLRDIIFLYKLTFPKVINDEEISKS